MNDQEDVSAIDRVMIQCSGNDLKGSTLFSTKFPNKDETKRIIAAQISAVFFLGRPDNIETARLLNSYPEDSKPFKIIRLEV